MASEHGEIPGRRTCTLERDAGSCTAGKKAAGAERTASMVSKKRLCERERVIDDAQHRRSKEQIIKLSIHEICALSERKWASWWALRRNPAPGVSE